MRDVDGFKLAVWTAILVFTAVFWLAVGWLFREVLR